MSWLIVTTVRCVVLLEQGQTPEIFQPVCQQAAVQAGACRDSLLPP